MNYLPKYNYPVGTIVRIDQQAYKPLGEIMPGRIHLMNCATGQPFLVPDDAGGTAFPTPDEYDRLAIDGRLEIELPAGVTAARALAAKAEWDVADLEAIDKDVRKSQAECEVLDTNGVKNGVTAIKAGLAKYWTEELRAQFGEHDNPHTIKRWRSERGTAGNRQLRDMVRLNGQVPRAPYLDDVPEEIKQKHALARKSTRGTMKSHYALAATELHEVNLGQSPHYAQPTTPYPIFSYDTFRRACIALDGSETTGERDGKQMVEATMRGGGKSLTASRILEKVIIDHTPLSAFLVVDPERDVVAGKPWLTVAFDVHSRVALGWVITFLPPSYWTVAEIILRMNLPKRPPTKLAARYPILKRLCGKPGELILDNAAEFTGHGLEDAAKGGSFSVRFCPIKQPRYRAIGERGLGTIEQRIIDNLPGESMDIEYNRRAGYNGEDLACVTMEELEALTNEGFAEYHTEPHDGLGDLQPALVFQKSANKHGIDVMGDVRRFRLETLAVQMNVKITKSGARLFNGLRYHCAIGVPRLIDNNLRYEPRRQPTVDATIHTKIKYDPANIAVIHAWDRTTNSYVELKCQDETYADGMPLWFHQQLREMRKAEATSTPGPEAGKRPRRSKAQQTIEVDTVPKIVRLSALHDEEEEVPGFNSEAERLATRTRTIAAIRAIAPGARHRERKTLARLYEIPRLRQITGNLVHLDTDYATAVSADDFIAHDVSAATALDAEILAPRPERIPRRRKRTASDDRRDAGAPRANPMREGREDTDEDEGPQHVRRSSRRG